MCFKTVYLSMNKYGAKKTFYNGDTYDSQREARHAQNLDWLLKAGEIKEWTRQHKLELIVNGEKICVYRMDFKVINKGGGIEYHEVKGYETKEWKLKWKLARAIYKDENITWKVIK